MLCCSFVVVFCSDFSKMVLLVLLHCCGVYYDTILLASIINNQATLGIECGVKQTVENDSDDIFSRQLQ